MSLAASFCIKTAPGFCMHEVVNLRTDSGGQVRLGRTRGPSRVENTRVKVGQSIKWEHSTSLSNFHSKLESVSVSQAVKIGETRIVMRISLSFQFSVSMENSILTVSLQTFIFFTNCRLTVSVAKSLLICESPVLWQVVYKSFLSAFSKCKLEKIIFHIGVILCNFIELPNK